jgi:uncharacterized membrane protein
MMALTAITFSIAFLVLQFGATAYSKRFVLLSGQSRIIAHALGMCFATFVYALLTLLWVDRFRNGAVPTISTTLVGVLLIASLVLLALLVHNLAELRVTRVLRVIGDKGREVIARAYTPGDVDDRSTLVRLQQYAAFIQASTPTQALRYTGPPRAVVYIDTGALVTCARNARGVIALQCVVGDTVTDGSLLHVVYNAQDVVPESVLQAAVYLAGERTFEGDPKYLLRLLVDTAIMALSPAINDPTTAVQALDEIEDLLHRLGACDLDDGYISDERGDLRVIVPTPTWEDYLSLAFDEIRICGADSLQVLRRLRSALIDLTESLDDGDRKSAVQRYLAHLDGTIEQSRLDPLDRTTASQVDPQGLGLARRAREI